MPILLDREKILSFPQLARALPRRRRDRPVHVSTIHRWRHPGVHGVRLEAIRIGGAWHTSWEKFQKFCEDLTVARGSQATNHTASDAPKQQNLIRHELDAEGW